MAAGLALPAILRGTIAGIRAAGRADITVGITVDTRPDWNGAENFIRRPKHPIKQAKFLRQ